MENVPWDPERPDRPVSLQLDRICWAVKYRKNRDLVTLRRAITIIEANGKRRHFDLPLDGRTGETFNNGNSRPAQWEGITKFCTVVPDDLDVSMGFYIENYGQFQPPHGLWVIDQFYPMVYVPPMNADGANR